MNIALIGMRGSGKTTIGKILARRLNMKFIDMDEYIVKKTNKTIPEIVKQNGWNEFRNLEEKLVEEISKYNDTVIATGGGVVLREQNINNLKKNSKIFWLTATVNTLIKRTGIDPNRPLLTKSKSFTEDMEITLKERENLYKNAADFIISTEEVINRVIKNINKKLEAMGDARWGALTRAHNIRFGALVGAIERQDPSPINSQTQVCCVIGNPVKHSLSPLIHNTCYKKLGLNFVYTAFEVEDIKAAVNGIRGLGIRGVSVTIPHKITIMKYLDKIDTVAKKIGAVNTIVNNNGKLIGYNTDWIGIVKPLENLTKIKDKKVAIIGAGGAARAIAYAITKQAGKLTIFNRTLETAQELAKEFDGSAFGINHLSQVEDMDIIINATSLGLTPNEDKTPVPKEYLNSNQIVFDIVFKPFHTRFLKEAKEKGAKIIPGIEMLLYQAFEQFKLYTGYNAPVKFIWENVNKFLIHNS